MTHVFESSEQFISLSTKERNIFPDIDGLVMDLSVHELNSIHPYLTIAGSLNNTSAISQQFTLLRTIIPTNQVRLHLCWFDRTIYIKPLPIYLLDVDYVNKHVYSLDFVFSSSKAEAGSLALGFMRSYCLLILTPLDLIQAKNLGLIENRVRWVQWHRWRTAVMLAVSDHPNFKVNSRYQYGELRLPRLNWIWRFKLRGLAYFTPHREYASYFAQYFQGLIIAFAFTTTLLQGMQVALAIPGPRSGAFDLAAYIVAIAAMVIVFLSALIIMAIFVPLFIYSALVTFKTQWEHRKSLGA
jgi:hypothetical protein